MKKIVMILTLCALLSSSLFAHVSSAIGVHVGTDTGLDLRLETKRFEYMGRVGIQRFQMFDPSKVDFDLQASVKVYTIRIGSCSVPLKLGLGMVSRAVFEEGKSSDWKIGFIVPVGFELQFEHCPVSLYFQGTPGYQFYDDGNEDSSFIGDATFGVLWNF